MGEELTAASTVVKTGERMEQALGKIRELQERFGKIRLADSGMWTNQNLSFSRAVGDMLILAEAILVGGMERKESRGSHYRTDFPDRDDKNFHKTTIAAYNPETGRPEISYREVVTGLVELRARTYGKTESTDEKDQNGAGDPAKQREQHSATASN